MSTEPEINGPAEPATDRKALRVIGWFSMGMAVATIGIYLGYELRNMYKFRRRTPYDFYSNTDSQPVSEFGVGI
ncbi:MAG TPA: hypothetical protein VKB38_08860 [Terracidiphilus sp.]|nr:hypothetical protein [Bryobacteraceae bacterium]HKF47454.1 hypothetical protein [Terracidiphilus sp.]